MTVISNSKAWADDDEEEELPSRQETPVNSKGIKTVTEYRLNAAGQRIKIVREIKVIKLEKRVPKVIAERKARMKKFGAAATSKDESNVTIVSTTDEKVTLEDPDAAGEGSQAANVKDAINEFARKQMWRKLQQKYGVDGDTGGMSPVPEDDDEELGMSRRTNNDETGAAPSSTADESGGMRSTYKIPHLRGKVDSGGSGGLSRLANASQDDHATLRVTNISEETAEADLQKLFSPYGRIARIYLAKDRETMASRGFAFVSFVHRHHAAHAMEALQGHGYDHLILKIEWAQPSNRSVNEEGGLSSMRTSGYGQKLAQDTTQRVAYASNLTANR
mmetsp:Transcript_375/g.503  ORF Transcript_375/g.503 Transcript_375/m.503 type:complete len:333 (-) Transcript_375:269-1267(-)|eukprot:CAMPEP_0197303224 /NCGR_PEP_ID=MMETSP0890-20130614/51530_1 /TAXON_ID=44058 ORGANISM="Aureoumbra lagunensis, Strain CCMP1510" /NCGR_SAMPLE_ID=MMETSP0890 /ASSEMBLY_ACC=CAM_ASM_000533 /LENGTH=332 /DNA_ID=CAMNT_0042783001 /DNA_START=36 /DNA_END=1034 /DNA_ORIENTATION=+